MAPVFARAAKGDVDAQAAMLDHMVMTALQPDAVCPEFLAAIEMWARLLATHGRPDDKRRLAGVLLFKGSIYRLGGRKEASEPLVSEGCRYLQQLADSGDERSASQLAELSRRLENDQAVPGEIMLGDVAPISH